MDVITRRTLLRGIGGLGLAAGLAPALLTACSTERVGEQQTPAAPSSGGRLRIGYLPITDAAPLLLAYARGFYEAEGLKPERPVLFRGWSQVAEAFQARQVDIVHILMPTAIWMRFGQRFPVKVVAWDHTDGSALTVANHVRTLDDLAGQTVAIPFWYSIHNVVLQLLLRRNGLKPLTQGEPTRAERSVKLVIMAPPDMPPALANGAIAGYIVADPFNAAAEVNKVGRILRFTGDIWLNHACCVVVMHEDDTSRRPEWAQAVVTAITKAQVWTRQNRKEAARLLSKAGGDFLPQPQAVIERALEHYDLSEYGATGAVKHPEWGNHRIDFQPFPFPSYTEELVKLLKETTVEGDSAFLQRLDPVQVHRELVEDRFARAAIQAAGGPASFGIPESLSRTERIAV